MTKEELKSLSTTTFFDNNEGGIVPSAHRAFNDALIDSMPSGMLFLDMIEKGIRISGEPPYPTGSDILRVIEAYGFTPQSFADSLLNGGYNGVILRWDADDDSYSTVIFSIFGESLGNVPFPLKYDLGLSALFHGNKVLRIELAEYVDPEDGGVSCVFSVRDFVPAVVQYTSQTLTESQKEQARQNMGASDFSGAYDDLSGKPDTLPNPSALTFEGAATGTYDGKTPVTINIPSGGGMINIASSFSVSTSAWKQVPLSVELGFGDSIMVGGHVVGSMGIGHAFSVIVPITYEGDTSSGNIFLYSILIGGETCNLYMQSPISPYAPNAPVTALNFKADKQMAEVTGIYLMPKSL